MDNKLTEDDINNIIEEVDEDGSGTLDFDGISQMVMKRIGDDVKGWLIITLAYAHPVLSRVHGDDGRLEEELQLAG